MEKHQVVIDYCPREAFEPYHESQSRYKLTVAHRRAGKTVARINQLIRAAASCEKPSPRFGYLAPYFVQAKDIAWNYLKQYAAPILAVGGKINESELSVTFAHNEAVIRLYGADSKQARKALLAKIRKQDVINKKRHKDALPTESDVEALRKINIEFVAELTQGWENFKEKFSQEQAIEFYEKYPVVYEQVDKFISDRNNYVKK